MLLLLSQDAIIIAPAMTIPVKFCSVSSVFCDPGGEVPILPDPLFAAIRLAMASTPRAQNIIVRSLPAPIKPADTCAAMAKPTSKRITPVARTGDCQFGFPVLELTDRLMLTYPQTIAVAPIAPRNRQSLCMETTFIYAARFFVGCRKLCSEPPTICIFLSELRFQSPSENASSRERLHGEQRVPFYGRSRRSLGCSSNNQNRTRDRPQKCCYRSGVVRILFFERRPRRKQESEPE